MEPRTSGDRSVPAGRLTAGYPRMIWENTMTERILLHPSDPRAPKYWMHEAPGGPIVPAIQRYLNGEDAQPDDVGLIRAYLRQWIDSPVWADGIDSDTRTSLDELRKKAREIQSRLDVDWWLGLALDLGIDPL